MRRRVVDVPIEFATRIQAYGTTTTVSIAHEGPIMLRFQTPLTAAAREILVSCLHVAADETVEWDEDQEAWAAAYPLACACFHSLAMGVSESERTALASALFSSSW